MIVVSDTSPITALLTVAEENLLPRLFDDVVIPEAVQNELLRNHSHLPKWLRVVRVNDIAQSSKYSQLVDTGEAESIELARELKADPLLINPVSNRIPSGGRCTAVGAPADRPWEGNQGQTRFGASRWGNGG